MVNRPNYFAPNDVNKASKQIKTTSSYYVKPLIFLYAKSLNQQWDKKTIKQTYLNSDYEYRNPTKNERRDYGNNKIEEISLKKQIEKHSNQDILSFNSNIVPNGCYFDFKDLFGLSSEESWRSYGKTIVKENVDKTSTSRSINSKNKNDTDYIDRFKSPILFKLIKENNTYHVFIIFSELPNEYIGSKFSVLHKPMKSSSSKLVLEIPSIKIQDVFDFIRDKTKFNYHNYLPVLRYNTNNKHELQKYAEPEKINSVLTNFFTQIQNQSNNDTK